VTHKKEDCPFKEADYRIYKKTGHIAKVYLSKDLKKIETIHLQKEFLNDGTF